ncbi:MAG: PilN domain-containing protein [Parafilimonas terrae]|nr:PilN domain-containing protein [Parafilimonas terrae]
MTDLPSALRIDLTAASTALAGRLAPIRAVIGGTWDGLVAAFTARIEPLLDRLVPQRRAVIVVEGDALVLYERTGRGSPVRRGALGSTGGEAPPRFALVDLRLPADQLLHRSFTLPSTGRAYLRPIIAHRLERLTPWRADRVEYGFAIRDANQADDTLAVDLLAVSADRLGPLLARLAGHGLVPTSLGSAADPIDAPPRIDLYADRPGDADGMRHRLVGRIALATLTGLAALCLASALLAQEAEGARDDASARLAALRSRIQPKQNGAASHDRLLIEAHRDASVLVLLDGLSAALPDTTVLREINLSSDKLRLVGRSTDAPALISRLEGEVGLSKVRFAAPVVRDAEGRDVFEIAAERPRKAAAPSRGAVPGGSRQAEAAR